MDDETMPWTSTTAFLADVVAKGGSAGRTLDVRKRDDGSWDVVLILDGGYGDRADAEGSMRIEIENLARAYLADVQAGRIEPASEANLVKIGVSRSQTEGAPPRP